MQISGYSSAAMLAYRSSGMKQKAGTVKKQDFSQMVQNTSAQATSQTDKTAATKEVSKLMRWQRSSRKSMRNWLKLIK
ncbi:MAG: hypothetical protein ACLSHX_02915 [Suilimivivens sp.]